jgi:phosphoribosylformimino-5-aminoimidazole carboxamide ribotide isomerase
LTDLELAARATEVRAAAIIYTSIGRDGTLEGPDIERTNAVAANSGVPVILSGGIGSMDHIREVTDRAAERVVGIIVGRAIYENAVSLEEIFSDGGHAGAEVVEW